jgi:cellulose biosynthesis protein BcsQ
VLEEALEVQRQAGLSLVSPSQFLAQGTQILAQSPVQARLQPGIRFLPPRVALFTNYAGGTGKTTLAICMARLFQQRGGLPCALIEIGLGSSALQARLGEKLPSLFSLVSQDQPAGKWQAIDIYPLAGREAQVLSTDPRLAEKLVQISLAHTLTVLDAHPASPLWSTALSLASDIFVVTDPRQDSLAHTAALLHEVDEFAQPLERKPRMHLVLNLVHTLGEKLQLVHQAAASLPFDAGRAERCEGSLASPLLNLLYPGWGAPGKGIRL